VYQAQIITIGHELLRGEIVNTNATYIAQELRKLGITVSSMSTLPDDRTAASDILRLILPEQGIVICTGGLGGTEDDVTRPIFSSVLHRKLVVDRDGEKHLRQWYTSRGRTFEDPDRMQASHPEGGTLLPNQVGLAFGFYVRDGERHIYALPGVPGEMKRMFHTSVVPQIESEGLFKRFGSGSYHYEILNFINIGEYSLDRIVHEIVDRHKGVVYGTRSSDGIVRVRLESSQEELSECIQEITCLAALQDNYLCRGEKNLEEVVGELLKTNNYTLSVAESCSGGLLAKLLTDVPGSSAYFLGGVVAYSNDAKKGLLGVGHKTLERFGAVSENVATEMALGALKRFSSDTAVAITGVAGPEGGNPQKPVGTVFLCLASRDGTVQVEKNQYLGDRQTVRLRSANKALFMLFRHVKQARRSGGKDQESGYDSEG
jgi:nicotinamide-nucleotide amidase